MYSIKTPIEKVVENIKKKYNIALEMDKKEKNLTVGEWLLKNGYRSFYKLIEKKKG